MKIGDLFIKLGLQKGEFDKGIDDAKKKTSMFGSAMGKIGGMIAGAFAVGQITSFLRESMKIAAETENVRKAFIRLGGGGYFNELNKAVRGTLSQVDLMKNTIQATNFGIPIKDLANLFKFATERAAQTGQSVEYLTQSIVMGVGRKSVLILDNLGISAVQLREKLKKVGEEAATVGDVAEAIGSIAQEQFKRMGEQATTTAQKLDDVKGSWTDIKVAIGDAINQSDIFTGGIKLLGDYLNVFSKQAENAMTNASSRVKRFMATMPESIDEQKGKIKSELEKINEEILKEQGKLSKFAFLTIGGIRAQKDVKQEINTLKNQAIELVGIFDRLKVTQAPVELMQRIKDLEFAIAMEKKLATQKGISAEEAITHANAIAKAEEELKKLREIVSGKTAEEQKAELEAQKKINDELDETFNKLENNILIRQKNTRDKNVGEELQAEIDAYQKYADDRIEIETYLNEALRRADEEQAKINKDKVDKMKEFTDELNQVIQSGLSEAIGSLASGFGEMLGTGNWNWDNFGKSLLDSVGKFMQTLGGLFIAYGIANLKFMKALLAGPTPMGAGLAIAAGIGLIAAGSAISSFAKKGVTGGTSASAPASGYSNYNQSSAQTALTGNVVFELDGYKLKGALNNVDRRNTLIR